MNAPNRRTPRCLRPSDCVAIVRDFLATVTSDELAATRRDPHAPEHAETVMSCLHVILEEEWEHHR